MGGEITPASMKTTDSDIYWGMEQPPVDLEPLCVRRNTSSPYGIFIYKKRYIFLTNFF